MKGQIKFTSKGSYVINFSSDLPRNIIFVKKNRMNNDYECKDCGWLGGEHQLDYETVDGCVGDDKLEVCPKCGSQRVFMV